MGTLPVPQLGVLRGSSGVTCHLWSKVPHTQGLQRAPGRWRGDKSFSLLGMRMEWLGPGVLLWAALAWDRGGDWTEGTGQSRERRVYYPKPLEAN